MNVFEKNLLKFLSSKQLKTIQSVKVGIGGAGGLGSNVAMILARSGFKHFELLDQDVIDASNLNRQQYFIDEIGQKKVQALGERLLKINPDLNIKVSCVKWTEEIGYQFFSECDFIIEAFDRAVWKHTFIEYYQNKTKYIISGNGMAGLKEKQPMRVKKLGNVYLVGDGVTDADNEHPPMAPRVTACSAMMAEIILDLALDLCSPLPPPQYDHQQDREHGVGKA